MRAAVMRRFGGPEVLRIEDVEEPKPMQGWVTVRLRAAALNWHDVLVRRGLYGSPLPHVPGADGAGEVVGTGEEVLILPSLGWGTDEAAPGPEWQILGDRTRGTYAEVVSVPQECVFSKPKSLTWAEAAALPLVGVTAYRALISRGGLGVGERLLVLGAGGGLAPMAVALATGVGAQVVVTSSSEEKIASAMEIGAVGGTRYDRADWVDAAQRIVGGGFDVVLDAVGTWNESLTALRPGGRLVVLGASRKEAANLSIRPFYFGQHSIIGTTMGSPRDLVELVALVEAGTVRMPPVDSVFPLAEVAAAHRRIESGDPFGKLILEI